jgi:hypothetical protein
VTAPEGSAGYTGGMGRFARYGVLGAALALGPIVAPGEERPAPSRPGLSWAEADAFSKKLLDLRTKWREGALGSVGSVLVTEAELNSYLNLSLAAELPAGLEDLEVRVVRDGLAATAIVDLERIQQTVALPAAAAPLSLLGGRVPVVVKGRLSTADGFGRVELDELSLASFPIPSSFLEGLVARATRSASNPQGVDLGGPFRLPYSVQRVRLEPGRAWIDF